MRLIAWKLVALAAVVACSALVVPGGAVAQRDTRGSSVSALERGVLAEINATRRQHGLHALRFSVRLAAAANQHSGAMAQRGFFAHDSADGTPFWKRVRRYYTASSYRYWSVGENLLWASPEVDAASALNMWMHSPEHKKILLTGEWREVGISAVHTTSAPGAYGGREVTIVTADFGVRR